VCGRPRLERHRGGQSESPPVRCFASLFNSDIVLWLNILSCRLRRGHCSHLSPDRPAVGVVLLWRALGRAGCRCLANLRSGDTPRLVSSFARPLSGELGEPGPWRPWERLSCRTCRRPTLTRHVAAHALVAERALVRESSWPWPRRCSLLTRERYLAFFRGAWRGMASQVRPCAS